MGHYEATMVGMVWYKLPKIVKTSIFSQRVDRKEQDEIKAGVFCVATYEFVGGI